MNADFASYILPELVILIPVLYAIGFVLKKSTKVPDEYIPCLLVGMGILLTFLHVISNTTVSTMQQWGSAIFASITQGVLCAATAVLSNQVIKQVDKATDKKE